MKNSSVIIAFIVLFSCENSKKKETTENPKPLLSTVQKHIVPTDVITSFKKKIDNWKEYTALNKFILKFKSTSPNEALSNALELNSLVEAVKDSVKPKILNTPAFNARIQVLYSETLRLEDMTYISVIKSKEVNTQIDKILESYAALNAKINTVFSKKEFEGAIAVTAFSIGLDTTKIDLTSLQSIKREKRNNSKDLLFTKKKIKKITKPKIKD